MTTAVDLLHDAFARALDERGISDRLSHGRLANVLAALVEVVVDELPELAVEAGR